jgi:hypothetical protein
MIAPRFLVFGVACATWLVVVVVWRESVLVRSAALAWFTLWGIQIAVVITFWLHPFSLPGRYYRPGPVHPPPWVRRHTGLRLFNRLARRINRHAFDRRMPLGLDVALGNAETTHVITFAIVGVLALVLVIPHPAIALFLTMWNVLFNVYPIALQRRNRWRVQRVAEHGARKRRAAALLLDDSPSTRADVV